MQVKETFLKLTARTYPHGTEEALFSLLPDNLEKDEFGNLFIKIGESSCLFTSHLDTASSTVSKVKHVINGNIIGTDGNSILGADDKAGVTIMLYMIEKKIPGLYYFFLGEERGCIGSKKVADSHKIKKIEGINKVISFDRRGINSVITFQSGSRCCSEKFANALSYQLNSVEKTFNYTNDPTGIYTDSVQFVKIYSECTNISVGYQNEHRNSETQDILHLEKLAEACVKINWNELPVERDVNSQEDETNDPFGDYDYSYKFKTKKEHTQKKWFFDKEFGNHISYIEIDVDNKEIIACELSQERLEWERKLIKKFIEETKITNINWSWNGVELRIEYDAAQGGDIGTYNRQDIDNHIKELQFWKKLTGYKTNYK